MDQQSQTAAEVVREYWNLMASNDFASVAAVLDPSHFIDWPQTNERIRGRERFIAMNNEYPANGAWRFTVHRIVGGDGEAVSEVSVTDGVQQMKAVTFFTVKNGLIVQQVEYWPEPYSAPANRKHLVEPIQ